MAGQWHVTNGRAGRGADRQAAGNYEMCPRSGPKIFNIIRQWSGQDPQDSVSGHPPAVIFIGV